MGLPIAHRRFTLHYVQRVSAAGIHWQPLLGNQPFLTVKQKVSPKKNHMKLLTLPQKPHIGRLHIPQLHPKASSRELHLLSSTQWPHLGSFIFLAPPQASSRETSSPQLHPKASSRELHLLSSTQKPYLGRLHLLSSTQWTHLGSFTSPAPSQKQYLGNVVISHLETNHFSL